MAYLHLTHLPDPVMLPAKHFQPNLLVNCNIFFYLGIFFIFFYCTGTLWCCDWTNSPGPERALQNRSGPNIFHCFTQIYWRSNWNFPWYVLFWKVNTYHIYGQSLFILIRLLLLDVSIFKRLASPLMSGFGWPHCSWGWIMIPQSRKACCSIAHVYHFSDHISLV